jgi:hypothetical protein
VDSMVYKMILNPQQYDVVVAPNLYGGAPRFLAAIMRSLLGSHWLQTSSATPLQHSLEDSASRPRPTWAISFVLWSPCTALHPTLPARVRWRL